MTLSNGGCKRTFEGDGIFLDRVDRRLRDPGLAVLQDWGDVDFLPVDGRLKDFGSVL